MIYLDNQSSTRTDGRVVEAMLPYFLDRFANPHSVHMAGVDAKHAVDESRQEVASLCRANRDEIFFTSGATESNNLAIRGLAPALRTAGKNHIVCSAIEHKCVLEVVKLLSLEGFAVDFVLPQPSGIVSLDAVKAHTRQSTGLICLMSSNNEVGTIQPIEAVGQWCRERQIAFHVDATQSFGKHALDVHAVGATTASFSAHKMHGPKGIGAIFIARQWRRKITPLIVGGGQEGGLRSGTVPVPLCVGFGVACRLAADQLGADWQRAINCRKVFLATLRGQKIDFKINGVMDDRLAGNLNICISNVDSEALIMALRDRVVISSGSACTTTEMKPSHVLQALGLPEEHIESSIRIGFGRFTEPIEAEAAALMIAEAANQLIRLKS